MTEKVLEKEAPAVTTVSTTGLLLERPMSTYTRVRGRHQSIQGLNNRNVKPALIHTAD